MAEGNGLKINGNLKGVLIVLTIATMVSGWAWGLGKGAVEDSVEINTEQIRANTDTIREVEKECTAIKTDLTNIKHQLDRIEDKLDRL